MADFSSIVADSHQEPNTPGVLTLAIIVAKSLTADWPVMAEAATGEITTPPPLAAGKLFARVTPPANSAEFMTDSEGRPAYESDSHEVHFEVAGYSKDLLAENRKHLNAGIVALAQLPDGKWVVLGSRQQPMFTNRKGKSGKAGNDERGISYVAKRIGYAWQPPVLADAVVSALTFAP